MALESLLCIYVPYMSIRVLGLKATEAKLKRF